MGSMFDMNQPVQVCQICGELHSKTAVCKYDVLVRRIHTLTGGIQSLAITNREAMATAKIFQKIIRDMTPQTERLVMVEAEYNNLVEALKNAKVYPFAPGNSPEEATPLVGVSVDTINELLPPDSTHNLESFIPWLKSRHPQHAIDPGTEIEVQEAETPTEGAPNDTRGSDSSSGDTEPGPLRSL